ncbi:MAG TPA: hypothetical protein VFT59_05445 [Candidatus Saccharimonadales bacterium]|nr:hypothetical protein [Candidatus Saccharimonadales bacterium]
MSKSRDSIKAFIKKYRILLLTTVVLLLVVSVYAAWSKVMWDSYQERTGRRAHEVKTKLDSALAMPGKNEEDRKKKLTALETAHRLMANGQECALNSLIDWQRLWGGLSRRVEECRKSKENLAALEAATEDVTSYLKNEQVLSDILNQAPRTPEVAEESWVAQVTAWNTVATQVSTMSSSEVFKSTKQTASNVSNSIATAWDKLLKAHKAQDKAGYEEAHLQLVRSYGGLSAISDVAASQAEPLFRKFDEAYAGAF